MKSIVERFSLFTKLTFTVGLVVLFYGLIARIIPIYFFWEASFFGCVLIVTAFVGYLITMIKNRKKEKRNTIGIKIGLGVVIFALFTQVLMSFIIPNSEAYLAAKSLLRKNDKLVEEVGGIEKFSFIPIGQLITKGDPTDYSGTAYFKIIVKGRKKYRFLSVTLQKDYGSEWEIRRFE